MSDYYEIHQIKDQYILKKFIEDFPLATIISSPTAHKPSIINAPIIFNGVRPEFHCANNNPDYEEFADNFFTRAIFMGPNAPISPSWYLDRFSKGERSHTAPTWNYLKVEIKGILKKMDSVQLKEHLERLVNKFEGQNSNGWSFKEIDPDFLSKLLDYITGFEIIDYDISGVFKLSQDQSTLDQMHIIENLKKRQTGFDLSLSTLMQEILHKKTPR